MDLKKYRDDPRGAVFKFIQRAMFKNIVVVEGKSDEVFYTEKWEGFRTSKTPEFLSVEKISKKLSGNKGLLLIKPIIENINLKNKAFFIIDKDFGTHKSNGNLLVTKGYSFENYIFMNAENKDLFNESTFKFSKEDTYKIYNYVIEEKEPNRKAKEILELKIAKNCKKVETYEILQNFPGKRMSQIFKYSDDKMQMAKAKTKESDINVLKELRKKL